MGSPVKCPKRKTTSVLKEASRPREPGCEVQIALSIRSRPLFRREAVI